MQAVIIDDSDLARANLKADLTEFCPEIQIIGEADGVLSAAKLLKSVQADLIFLDIEMGDGDGFDLLDIIQGDSVHVIFVTGSKEFAIKAFQYAATDYLLKPIDPDLLVKSIQKIKEKKTQSHQKHNVGITNLALHTSDEIRIVPTEEILRCESEGNYTIFHFIDQSKLITSKTLKDYASKLEASSFLRVHQSHLVNMRHIKSFVKNEGGYILMRDGSQIPVSVRKKAEVMQILGS